jgi:hypothetical protein
MATLIWKTDLEESSTPSRLRIQSLNRMQARRVVDQGAWWIKERGGSRSVVDAMVSSPSNMEIQTWTFKHGHSFYHAMHGCSGSLFCALF